MGLLTDPRAGNVKMFKFLLKWESLLCFILYICGIVYLALLPLPMFNDGMFIIINNK